MPQTVSCEEPRGKLAGCPLPRPAAAHHEDENEGEVRPSEAAAVRAGRLNSLVSTGLSTSPPSPPPRPVRHRPRAPGRQAGSLGEELGIEKIRNRKEHFPQGFNNWNVCRDAWKEILKCHPQHARPLGMVCLGGWGGGRPPPPPSSPHPRIPAATFFCTWGKSEFLSWPLTPAWPFCPPPPR